MACGRRGSEGQSATVGGFAAQGAKQGACVWEPAQWCFVEAAGHHCLQFGGEARVHDAQEWRGLVCNLLEKREHVVATERALARRHLEQDRAERIEIGARVYSVISHLL